MSSSAYEILQVPETATQREIKNAYKRLALLHHPDKGGEVENFRNIASAYDNLESSRKRKEYDEKRNGHQFTTSWPQNGSGTPGSTQFSTIFRPGQSTGFDFSFDMNIPNTKNTNSKSNKTPRTPHIHHKIYLSLEDMYSGKKCKFAISRKARCDKCQGRGGWDPKTQSCVPCGGTGFRVSSVNKASVKKTLCLQCRGEKTKTLFDTICTTCHTTGYSMERIVLGAIFEPGTKPGQKLVLENMSHFQEGKTRGHVIIVALEKRHRFFQRTDNVLKCEVDITLMESICGFTKEIHHLDGRVINIASDGSNVTPPGSKMVFKGEGIPKNKGSLEVTINVKFPKYVNPELSTQFAQICQKLEDSTC